METPSLDVPDSLRSLNNKLPGLVNIQETMERSTMFNGKTHYFDWAMFQFAMLAYQGVTLSHENINHWDILTISIMEIQITDPGRDVPQGITWRTIPLNMCLVTLVGKSS